MDSAKTLTRSTAPVRAGLQAARCRRLAAALVICSLLPLAGMAADQSVFASPEGAVDALAAALKADDERALVGLFGEKYRHIVNTGEPAYDAARRAEVAQALTRYRAFDERGPDRRVLLLGEQAWPFAIPLVREGSTWRFASELGVEELLNRRIGANERNAIAVLRAYLAAQRQYASVDRDGDGVLQYARRLASTPGRHDGLYWPADAAKGEEASPFGPLVAESAGELTGHRPGAPYRGYRFRILTAQSAAAPGGAYSYLINGRLLAGFAMVAYPASYGTTGVMTFIVSHNGPIYERNLGPRTEQVASRMSTFDPGAGWSRIDR